MNKQQVLEKVCEILQDKCEDPAKQIILIGQVLIDIGNALEGRSLDECRNIIVAAAVMHGIIIK